MKETAGTKSEGHGKDSKSKPIVTGPAAAVAAATASVLPTEAVADPSPLVVWPESSKVNPLAFPAPNSANKRRAELLGLEPQAAQQALAATLAVLGSPEGEAHSFGLVGRAALRGGGQANGDEGSSSTEGHSTAPPPGPGPGGSGGGSAAGGGGSAAGSSATSNLVDVYFNVPVSVMHRLGIAERSARQTFFLLIPEKPD